MVRQSLPGLLFLLAAVVLLLPGCQKPPGSLVEDLKEPDQPDSAVAAEGATTVAESIVTQVDISADASPQEVVERFLNEVDAGVVFANTSTRFNDGAVFGLGAEVAISTNKLHARGPMGLKEITSYKWKVRGQGQIRH